MHLFCLDILCTLLCHLGDWCDYDGNTLFSRLVPEGDASFLAGHLLLTGLTHYWVAFVNSGRHILLSRMYLF